MNELLYAPLPNRQSYLDRLGLSFSGAALSQLNALIYAHQCCIPFEDLDICDFHLPVSLEIPSLYEKIIAKRRGGYCFELNALFSSLLADCGYHAAAGMSRIYLGMENQVPAPLHRVVLVFLEGNTYFCDVGFGGPMPAGALLLKNGHMETICGQTFSLEQEDAHWWKLYYHAKKGRMTVLSFCTVPSDPVDFITLNYYCSTHTDSLFTSVRLANIRTPKGSLSLTDNTFCKTENGIKTTVTPSDEKEYLHLLKAYFGICL